MFIRLLCYISISILFAVIPQSIQAAPSTPFRTFADSCKQGQRLPAETINTITSILTKLGTENCQQAQAQLRSITALRITELHPFKSNVELIQPLSYLSLDMPFTVDLRLIVVAMPNLQQLDLSNTLIADFAPIRSLTQLEDLNLSNTQLKDVNAVATLTNLVHLNISHNQVRDISSIGKLKELQHFDFSYNQIRDLSVLATLPKLFSIRLTNNPVDSATCSGQWTSSCEN